MTVSSACCRICFHTKTPVGAANAKVCVGLPDGDQLSKVQLVVINLSNKDGRHSLVKRRAVHVNGGSNREDKASNLPVNVAVFQQAFHGDGKRGRAEKRWWLSKLNKNLMIPTEHQLEQYWPGGGGQSDHHGLQQPTDVGEGILLGEDEVEEREDDETMDEEAGKHGDTVPAQLLP